MTPEVQLKILEIGVGGAIILFVIAMSGVVLRMMVKYNSFLTEILDKFNVSLDKRDENYAGRLTQILNFDKEQRDLTRTAVQVIPQAIDCLDRDLKRDLKTHDDEMKEHLVGIKEELIKQPDLIVARMEERTRPQPRRAARQEK